jgi:drug/metabolite transporter (DMT)-like permease
VWRQNRAPVSPPRPAFLVLGLGGAIMALSSAAPVILLADPLPATVIAAGRVAVTGVVLLVLGARSLSFTGAALRQPGARARVLGASALLALHFGAWVASLGMTSVPRSVALVATQPLFAGILGRLVGDRAPWSLYGGAVLAVVGTLAMVGGVGEDAGGFNLGDGLALLAGAAAAGYLVVGRSVGQSLPLPPYLGLVHVGAAVMLIAAAPGLEAELWPAEATAGDAWALVYLGLVPGVVGHGLLNWAVRYVPVHVVALVILFEPVGATAITVLALGHSVGVGEAIGAGVLLGGVGVGLPWRRRR